MRMLACCGVRWLELLFLRNGSARTIASFPSKHTATPFLQDLCKYENMFHIHIQQHLQYQHKGIGNGNGNDSKQK
jgi:hypothetical protein